MWFVYDSIAGDKDKESPVNATFSGTGFGEAFISSSSTSSKSAYSQSFTVNFIADLNLPLRKMIDFYWVNLS